MAATGTGSWAALPSNPNAVIIDTPSLATTRISGFIASGTYSFTWTGDTVLVSVIACPHDTVWPGDADANHIVDNNDLLTIGVGYDSVGPVRINATTVWQGQQVTAWPQFFSSYSNDPNYDHADCNGDGIINADDTLAIVTNFGLTHAKTTGQGLWRSGIPALRAILSADTLYVNDTLYVAFVLGDSNLVVNNFYGIAFTYNFDPLVVDSTFTSMNFGTSWIGNASNTISLFKTFNASGQIKAAITRINHTSVSGNGAIATCAFKITTDNISGKDLQYYTNVGSISDITLIDQLGNRIPLNAGADTSQIGYTPLGIREIISESIHVQPNPAHNTVNISAGNAIREINITNVMGQEVMQNKYANSKSLSVDMSAYDSGVYFVRVRTDRGMGMVKLVIER